MPRFVWLFMMNSLVIFILMAVMGLRINISESYPVGIYIRVDGEHTKNNLVESCLPEKIAQLMVERSYIPNAGNCGGYPAVIKQIFGVAGDHVVVGENVSINGTAIANTPSRATDNKNRVLTPANDTVIDKEHVWLMSNVVPNSYDARYFGQTPVELIISNLKPVWIKE